MRISNILIKSTILKQIRFLFIIVSLIVEIILVILSMASIIGLPTKWILGFSTVASIGVFIDKMTNPTIKQLMNDIEKHALKLLDNKTNEEKKAVISSSLSDIVNKIQDIQSQSSREPVNELPQIITSATPRFRATFDKQSGEIVVEEITPTNNS